MTLSPDPPHLQALAALQADLPISIGVSVWLDNHRAQVKAVLEGLSDWGQLATLLGISPNSLRSWGVRRGLRTRKPREKKPREKKARQPKAREVHLRSPHIIRTNEVVQLTQNFKGIKLTLTLEFLEEGR